MIGVFKPAPHIQPLSQHLHSATYKRMREQLFIGIFIGYAGYYLVRKNFSLAIPHLVEQGFSRGQLGIVLSAVSIAYGLSKFLMGSVSDRSNPRFFLSFGLLLSSAIMLLLGWTNWATSSLGIMFVLLFLNGWFQGMGWPACGRVMVHWWSGRERGQVVSWWNIAHNIGGGLIGPIFLLGIWMFNDDWKSAFYMPALFAIAIAALVLILLRDTPQSCGLPTIEAFNNDYPGNYHSSQEQELKAKAIFFKYIFPNKVLWVIAIANAFIYLIRYGVLDWAPLYLKEAKDFSIDASSWAYFLYEWAGIPGTLLCGWISDKWFKGRRAPAGILFMGLVTVAILVYWFNPAGNPNIDRMALFTIGFLIYGPVMLIGLYALELAPKKAAGTAAGLTGIFGYLGGAVAANIILGYSVDYWGWTGGFILLTSACVLAICCLLFAHFQAGGQRVGQSAVQKARQSEK